MTERPSWDEVWSRIAATFGERSRCHRAQIGAVIVTTDNRLAAVGYAGPPSGLPTTKGDCRDWCPRAQPGAVLSKSYDECATIHAEVNAIMRSDWHDRQGATVYVNGSTCQNCAKVVAGSGIARLVHVVNEGDAHRAPEKVEEYLRSCGIDVERWSPTQRRMPHDPEPPKGTARWLAWKNRQEMRTT